MLKLLTDEHISPAVAPALKRLCREQFAISLHEWENGQFLGASDAIVLGEAATHGLTMVTFDVRTIPPLLKSWAEVGKDQAGVVFVDQRTYSQNEIGGIARALRELTRQFGEQDWSNRYFFL